MNSSSPNLDAIPQQNKPLAILTGWFDTHVEELTKVGDSYFGVSLCGHIRSSAMSVTEPSAELLTAEKARVGLSLTPNPCSVCFNLLNEALAK